MRSKWIRSLLISITLALGYVAIAAGASAMPAPLPDDDAPALPSTVVVHHSGTPLWVFGVVVMCAVVIVLAGLAGWSWRRHSHSRPAIA